MKDREKELYFMCCLARDRGINVDYFDFDKRSEINDFMHGNKEVNEYADD